MMCNCLRGKISPRNRNRFQLRSAPARRTRRFQLPRNTSRKKTRKTTIGIPRANLCRGRRTATPPGAKRVHPSNRVGSARRSNGVMIPIAGMVGAKVVVAVIVVVAGVVVVAVATVLMTVVVHRTRINRSVRREIISKRPFPHATIARNIRTPSRWPRNARWPATTVSARRIPSRTKTRVARTKVGRKIPVNANFAKKILMSATPRRWKPGSAARKRNRTKRLSNANRISAAMIHAVMTAANMLSRDMVAVRKIIARKMAVVIPKISARKVVGITRRIIVRKVVAISRAIARAAIAATGVVRRRVVVAHVTGSKICQAVIISQS